MLGWGRGLWGHWGRWGIKLNLPQLFLDQTFWVKMKEEEGKKLAQSLFLNVSPDFLLEEVGFYTYSFHLQKSLLDWNLQVETVAPGRAQDLRPPCPADDSMPSMPGLEIWGPILLARRLICADSCHFPPYCNSGGHLDHHLLWSLIRLLVGRDQNIRDSQHTRCIFSTSSQIRVKSEDEVEGTNYLEKGCVQYRGYN